MPHRRAGEPFEITENRVDGRAQLSLEGHLDYTTAPELARRIRDLRSAGYRDLELDLTRLGYFDTGGLAILMDARRKFADEQGLLVLRGASPYLRKVLDITGLARFFAFAEATP